MNTNNASKKRILSAGLFAASLTLFIYLTAINNEFVNWDDQNYVYENQNIRVLNLDLLKWSLTSVVSSNWHPLTMLSLALDYNLWGLSPWGYHLTNIIIHVINTFLVFVLAVFLFRLGKKSDYGDGGIFVGFLTAILFGIHPLHVESVAWISERKDVLSGLFWLLSMLSYLSYASRADNRRFFYFIIFIFFLLALMSKPMAVTLPVVFLLLDIYPLRRINGMGELWSKKRIFIEKLPLLLLSISASMTAVIIHKTEGVLGRMDTFPLIDRITIAMKGYLFYLCKMLFPVNLAAIYPYPSYYIELFSPEFFGPLAIMSSITLFAFLIFKRNKIFFVAWLYYVITLLPVIGIIQVGKQAAADRYTYLPGLAPFFLFSLGISIIYAGRSWRYRMSAIAASVILFVFLTVISAKQISIWQNSYTLWSRVISIMPDHPFGYDLRARGHFMNKNLQWAIDDINTAIRLDPVNPDYHYKLGQYHIASGNVRQSLINLSRAIELDGSHAKAYFSRGRINVSLGNFKLAIEDLDVAIRLDPKNSQAFYARGLAFLKINKNQSAISSFDEAIRLDPAHVEAYNSRGNAYRNLGALDDALRNYNKAIEISPNDAIVYNNRGMLYIILGNMAMAVNDFKRAIELRPGYAEPHYNLGKVYSQLGRNIEAEEYYKRAELMGRRTK